MKLVFLGDSITEGVGASRPENNYVNVVAKMLGCVVENYGIGGTRIARQMSVSPDTRWDLDFRLHPNDKGHSFIANKIVEYLKKSF